LQRLRSEETLDPSTLKRLDLPTLLIWGAKDKWVPPADAFRFQHAIKGARLAIFSELGHDAEEEDPEATAAAVDAFLPAKLEPPAPPTSDQPQPQGPQNSPQPQEQGAPAAPAGSADMDQQRPPQPQPEPPHSVAPATTPEKD